MSTFIRHFGQQQSDGTYAISASDLSIMSSMINVGELVGSLGAAPLNDFLGRKGAFLVAAIVAIIGTVLQTITDHDKGIIIGGRVILGLGVGVFSSTSPLYIGVSHASYVMLYTEHRLIIYLGGRPDGNERTTVRMLATHHLTSTDHRCCG